MTKFNYSQHVLGVNKFILERGGKPSPIDPNLQPKLDYQVFRAVLEWYNRHDTLFLERQILEDLIRSVREAVK
jgi:hypothetical protein